MDAKQLQQYIIEPTLKEFGLYSLDASALLLRTCAVESYLGKYIHQIDGPALGIFQMEPRTHVDIWQNFLASKNRKSICHKIILSFPRANSEKLIYDLKYATLMARLLYLRIKEPIPLANDLIAQANYWKNHYNTRKGKGTVSKFICSCEKLLGENYVAME